MKPPTPVLRPWVLAAGVGIVAILVLAGVAGLLAGTAARVSLPSSAVTRAENAAVDTSAQGAGPQAPAGMASSDVAVRAAVSSLAHGGGPAHGISTDCAVRAGGEATCGGTPIQPAGDAGATGVASTPRSASPTTTPQWYDVETNLSTESGGKVPSVEFAGRMAYDPLLSEVVLFDGCTYPVCPDNQTWTYNGISWTDLTSPHASAPSPREGAGLDYDPLLGGVVLFGGTNQKVNFNDTWLFTGAGWSNITATVGIPQKVGGGDIAWSWGAMAFDPALDTMVVVDGCADPLCSDVWNYTWFLNAGRWGGAAPGPGALTNLTALAYSSAAYDAAGRDLILFGGFDARSNTSSNDTFLLNASRDWVNITSDDAGCVDSVCYTPPGRDSEGMTWDSQLDAIFMTDGYNATKGPSGTGTLLNDSWIFSGRVWLPANLTAPSAPSGYCPAAQPAMPESSNNVAPIIIGGSGPCSPGSSTSEWVYEVPPQPTLTALPPRFDLGTSTTFNASWSLGTGSGIVATWNVSFGDGQYNSPARSMVGENTSTAYSQTISHTYGAAGTFQANVTWTDFFYVSGTFSVPSVTVYPGLVATIDASATSITAGESVTFSTAPAGGDPPYWYAWSLGDGTTSTARDPPTHTYSNAGFYTVDLTVTDNTGQPVKSTVVITVATPGIHLSSTDIYLIVAIVFVVVATLVAVVVGRRRKKPAPAPPAHYASSDLRAGAGAPPTPSRPAAGGPPRRPPPP